MRESLGGRAGVFRHVTFLLRDNGTLAVLDDEKVIEEFASFARALTTFGLRRSDLEVVREAQ